MILPSWTTHLAIDEDGEVTAFDRAPVFLPPDSETCGLWALPDCTDGQYKIVKRSERTDAPVYPVEVAERLCVSLEHFPVWVTHVAIDASDGMACAYSEVPVWRNDWGMWFPASHMGRCEFLDYTGILDASVARTLCFAISAPPEGPHTAT